jgi:hypothetical protein
MTSSSSSPSAIAHFIYYIVLRLVSDISLFPALIPLYNQKRHFPLFVAIVQLLSLTLFDATLVFSWQYLFIKGIEWHFISDVMSLTYGINVCIHLANFQDEEIGIVLRYLGFFLSWITKYKDNWNSILAEMILVIFFIVITIASHAGDPSKRKAFRPYHLSHALGAGFIGFICFFSCQRLRLLEEHSHPISYPIVLGLSHVFLGYASYHVWNVLPPGTINRNNKPSLGGTTFV